MSLPNYFSTKLALNPNPHPLGDTDLVIFRDSDIVSVEEEEFSTTGKPLRKTSKIRPPTSCSHDRLGYNIADPTSGLRQSPQETWANPFGLNDHNRAENISLLP
jgi:hypothetical protein